MLGGAKEGAEADMLEASTIIFPMKLMVTFTWLRVRTMGSGQSLRRHAVMNREGQQDRRQALLSTWHPVRGGTLSSLFKDQVEDSEGQKC